LTATSRAPRVGEDSEKKIARRVNRTLEHFQSLPDDARIDVHAVCALLGRSRASIYRDVEHGRLAHQVKIGHSARWRVGDVRAALKGGACSG
jgi:predicted DNA-binding transcriptional regulator AlpA